MLFINKIKASIGNHFFTALDAIGIVFGLSGVAIAVFFGKVLLALIFIGLTLAALYRLTGRLQKTKPKSFQIPLWKRAIVFLLALFAAALLVEAFNLPIRFDQPQFRYWHWLLVSALLFAFYLLFKKLAWTNSNK